MSAEACGGRTLRPPAGPFSLAVVMPAYNEAELLDVSVRAVVAGLRARPCPFELRIVENGSTDATGDVASQLAGELPEVAVVRRAAADYGAAIRAGLESASAPVCVIFDVDHYDLDFLDRALRVLDTSAVPTGPVAVVGSKRAPGALDHRSPVRRAATSSFALLLQRGFGLDVSDTHGMKVLRRDVLAATIRACRYDADLFDTELLIRATRSGFRVAELPVAVHERRPPRTSLWSRVPRTVWGLVALRWSLRRG